MSYDPNYGTDREFGDLFLNDARGIMGNLLQTTKYQVDDMERNTDLIVLTMASKRTGMRVRRNKYLERYDYNLQCPYRDEITIRYSKESGHITEYEKVLYGFGDYFLYAFADGNTKEDSEHLCRFVVMDYNRIRAFIIQQFAAMGRKEFEKDRIQDNPNGDKFIVFRIHEIPYGIVADSDNGWKLDTGWFPIIEEEIL